MESNKIIYHVFIGESGPSNIIYYYLSSYLLYARVWLAIRKHRECNNMNNQWFKRISEVLQDQIIDLKIKNSVLIFPMKIMH